MVTRGSSLAGSVKPPMRPPVAVKIWIRALPERGIGDDKGAVCRVDVEGARIEHPARLGSDVDDPGGAPPAMVKTAWARRSNTKYWPSSGLLEAERLAEGAGDVRRQRAGGSRRSRRCVAGVAADEPTQREGRPPTA